MILFPALLSILSLTSAMKLPRDEPPTPTICGPIFPPHLCPDGSEKPCQNGDWCPVEEPCVSGIIGFTAPASPNAGCGAEQTAECPGGMASRTACYSGPLATVVTYTNAMPSISSYAELNHDVRK